MKQRIITNTALSTYGSCPRKWQLRYVEGLSPMTKAPHLRIGTRVHELVQECMLHRHAEILSLRSLPHEASGPEDYENAYCVLLARGWLRYLGSPFDAETVPEIEVEAYERIQGDAYMPIKLDALGLRSGMPTRWELKTSGRSISDGDAYVRQLSVDPQQSRYGALLWHRHVRSVVYDVIVKPQSEPRSVPVVDEDGLKIVLHDQTGERAMNKNGSPRQVGGEGLRVCSRTETLQEYIERLETEITPANYHRWVLTSRLPVLQAQIRDDLEIIRRMDTSERHPRNWGACKYSHCPYQVLCREDVTRVIDPTTYGLRYEKPNQELEHA